MAPGAKPGIQGQHPLLAQGRRQEQAPQIGGEDPYRLGLGPGLHFRPGFGLQGGRQQALAPVGEGGRHFLGVWPAAAQKHPPRDVQDFLLGRPQAQCQEALGLPPQHRQGAVSRDGAQRLVPVEPVAEGGAGLLLPLDDLGLEPPAAPGEIANGRAQAWILGHLLGQDVPGAGQGALQVQDVLVRPDKGPGQCLGVAALLGPKRLGQGFEPAFPGHGGPGPAFGPVGQVDVFQPGFVPGLFHRFPEFAREQPAFFQGGQDRLAALVQFGQLLQAVPDGGNGHFIQGPGGFLAVACHKGHRGPLANQLGHGCHLGHGQGHFLGDTGISGFVHAGVSLAGLRNLAAREAEPRSASP